MPVKPYIHKIQYYECDGMGVTHHSNYLRIMEEARLDLLSQEGFSYRELESKGIVSPVVRLSIRYVRSTTFGDEVEVTVRAIAATPYRLKFEYEMRVGGEVVCTAENTNCFISGGRPKTIDECMPGFSAKLR